MKTTATTPLDIRDPAPPLRRAALRILVVERDSTDRSEVTDWLRADSRVDVEAFASAEQALTQSSGDSYDLCLLDYALDGVDGVMLGAMIRTLNPGARLILMSEAVSAPLLRRAIEHGFQQVVAKPVAQADLVRLLASLAA